MHVQTEVLIRFDLVYYQAIFNEVLVNNASNGTLIEHLLDDTPVIRRILEGLSENPRVLVFSGSKRETSSGARPLLVKLANTLVKQEESCAQVKNSLNSIPEWTEFQAGALAEINGREQRPLCGKDPRNKKSFFSDEEEPADPHENFLKKLVNFNPLGDRKKDKEKEEEEEEEVDLERYFGADEEKDTNSPDKASGRDRYKTIEDEEEEEDEPAKYKKGSALQWMFSPVEKENDDEQMIDDNIEDVAMEIIGAGRRSRNIEEGERNGGRADGIRDDLFDIMEFSNREDEKEEDKEEWDPETGEVEVKAAKREDEQPAFYDHVFWRSNTAPLFKIEDLLDAYI